MTASSIRVEARWYEHLTYASYFLRIFLARPIAQVHAPFISPGGKSHSPIFTYTPTRKLGTPRFVLRLLHFGLGKHSISSVTEATSDPRSWRPKIVFRSIGLGFPTVGGRLILWGTLSLTHRLRVGILSGKGAPPATPCFMMLNIEY